MNAPRTRWIVLFAVVSALVGLCAPAQAMASEPDRAGILLTRGSGYDRADGSDQVRTVQRHLRAAGVDPGPVDGRFGSLTEAAVRRFQSARGLAVDGIVGPRTRPVLRGPAPLAPGAGVASAPGLGGRARDAAASAHARRRSRPHRRTLRSPDGGRGSAVPEGSWPRGRRDRRFAHRAPAGAAEQGGGPAWEQAFAAASEDHATPPPAPTEHPPTVTTPRPAHRPPPIVATPARKPDGSPDGLDPLEMAAVIALIAGAGLLLVAGGVSWRRRRARRIVPASQVATATAAGPAALQAGRLERGQQLPPRDEARRRRGERPARACRAGRSGGPHVPRAMKSRRIRALGYVSVPPELALEAGAGPQAQAIEAACAARGWAFVGGVREPEPANGKGLERPGLPSDVINIWNGPVRLGREPAGVRSAPGRAAGAALRDARRAAPARARPRRARRPSRRPRARRGLRPGLLRHRAARGGRTDGSVVGVDASADMLAVAAKRAGGHDNVEFHEADATSLPVADASFDRALCVQVLEYVRDVSAALEEMRRALRPGGRVLVWDVDWATVSWHAIARQS